MPRATAAARLRQELARRRMVKPVTPTRTNPRTGQPERVAGVDNTLQTQAEQIAAGLLDPQTAAINRAIAASERQELARGKAFEGVAAALSQYTAGIPEGIRSAYQTAADRTAGYGAGLSGALGEAASGAAREAGQTIANIGPAGAGGPVASEGGALANVTNYLGGFLPASNLAAEAASRMAEASTMRAAGGARIAEEALASMRATRGETEELRMRGLDLERTRPAEIQKALKDLRNEDREERQMKLQERAFQVQTGELQLARAKTKFDQAEAMTNLTGYVHIVKNGKVVRTKEAATGSDSYTAAQTQANQNARTAATQAAIAARAAAAAKKPNATMSKVNGYLTDSNGKAILKNGKRQPYKQTGGGTSDGLTPSTRSTIMGKANTIGKTRVETFYAKIWSNTPGAQAQGKNESNEDFTKRNNAAKAEFKNRLKKNRAVAIGYVVTEITPQLKLLKYTPAQIKAEAARIVSARFPK